MKPLYPPETLKGMLGTMGKLNELKINLGVHPGMASVAQPVVTDNHHCVSCGEKQDFTVENEETMDNGAVRRSGTCNSCGGVVSKFARGSKPKAKVKS